MNYFSKIILIKYVCGHKKQGTDTYQAFACVAGVAGSSFEAGALGRSKGGFTTKIHAITDALGNPLDFRTGWGIVAAHTGRCGCSTRWTRAMTAMRSSRPPRSKVYKLLFRLAATGLCRVIVIGLYIKSATRLSVFTI